MKLDVGHIHTFGYIVHIMDNHRAMGYLMGYQYEGVFITYGFLAVV